MTNGPEPDLHLAVVISGGVPGRSGPAIAEWFVQQAGRHPDFAVDVIDLTDVDLPQSLARTAEHEGMAAQLMAADAFVFITPEYNHGYPGGLKNFIDMYRHEWLGKAAGFVSFGGRSGGLRAVEQLRQVMVEQHMVSIRDSLGFDTARQSASTSLATDPGLPQAAAAMLDQLAWWAGALRRQRMEHPYKP